MNLSSIDIVGFLAYFAIVAKPVPRCGWPAGSSTSCVPAS